MNRYFQFVMLLGCFFILACDNTKELRESRFSAGAPALGFSLPDLKGQDVALADFRGKVVMLNFWATWCAPCVAEMPSMQNLRTKLKDRGFEIIAVNVDPPGARSEVEKFVAKNNIEFPVLLDPQLQISQKYGLEGFPESFFISREGVFLDFEDPETRTSLVRIISDRVWDKPAFVEEVSRLLGEAS